MIEQGTQAWKNEKLGVISGTRAYDLMSSNTTRRTLLATLIRELTTASGKEFSTKRLNQGLEIEPEAASYYSLMNSVEVTDQSAYFESDINPMFAVSPDGLVGKDGGFEGKRLDAENHIKMLLGATPEKKYVMQCYWGMFIRPERKWWDLFYYCEDLPDSMRTHTIRFERDDKIIDEMDKRANEMLLKLSDFLHNHGLGGLI